MESLQERWQELIKAQGDKKEILFHPHLRQGKPGDKHTKRVVKNALQGYKSRPIPIAEEQGRCETPIRYGFRSFDRQWIVPDNRLINQPNPELWELRSDRQVFLTAFMQHSPTAGPALTFTGLIPDLHHYKGSFGGRVFPLWRDRDASVPNIPPNLLAYLTQRYEKRVTAEDLVAYIAAIAAHPAYTERFQSDLVQPGLRIPLTASTELFTMMAELGRTVIWLHTFGERFADPRHGRPAGPPRLPPNTAPRIPVAGAISQEPSVMPDTINYDEHNHRLLIGSGYIDGVSPQMWNYEVSGKKVLRQWFSYRKKNRERPIHRRPTEAIAVREIFSRIIGLPNTQLN